MNSPVNTANSLRTLTQDAGHYRKEGRIWTFKKIQVRNVWKLLVLNNGLEIRQK